MKPLKEMSLKEIGGYICDALLKQDIHVVLSGGSCVEIYSHGDYTSHDLDFINQYNERKSKIREVMLDLGFTEETKYFFHDDISHIIEFPPGPLGIGDEHIHKISKINTQTGILRLLTPTDCIKDRLAAFYHWDDEQSLQQAIWVAKKNDCNLHSIKKWSINEGMEIKHRKFEEKLN